MILSEVGADITIFSAGKKTESTADERQKESTAMARAIGILEPQGRDFEQFFRGSVPFFEELARCGAPLRRDRVVYFYKDAPNQDFVQELQLLPHLNHKVEAAEKFGCKSKVSFEGYIMSGSAMRDFYMGVLKERGVEYRERTIETLAPEPDHLTFSALGMGRKLVRSDSSVDIPGNYGQMICIEGTEVADLLQTFPELKNIGSVGIPSSAGSVNIVLHYRNPRERLGPYLIIGATKNPGDGKLLLREPDNAFLMNGVKILWPALHAHLEKFSTATDTEFSPAKFNPNYYGCVRPGSGASPFQVVKVNGCIDISGAGGMGNTLAPAASLKAISLAF